LISYQISFETSSKMPKIQPEQIESENNNNNKEDAIVRLSCLPGAPYSVNYDSLHFTGWLPIAMFIFCFGKNVKILLPTFSFRQKHIDDKKHKGKRKPKCIRDQVSTGKADTTTTTAVGRLNQVRTIRLP